MFIMLYDLEGELDSVKFTYQIIKDTIPESVTKDDFNSEVLCPPPRPRLPRPRPLLPRWFSVFRAAFAVVEVTVQQKARLSTSRQSSKETNNRSTSIAANIPTIASKVKLH
jgi:hypothetical protein